MRFNLKLGLYAFPHLRLPLPVHAQDGASASQQDLQALVQQQQQQQLLLHIEAGRTRAQHIGRASADTSRKQRQAAQGLPPGLPTAQIWISWGCATIACTIGGQRAQPPHVIALAKGFVSCLRNVHMCAHSSVCPAVRMRARI